MPCPGARFSGRQSRRFKLRAFATWEPVYPSPIDASLYNGYAAQNHGDHVKPYARQSMAERPQPGRGPHYSEGLQPKPQPESESNPFGLLSRVQRGEGERSHEELVAIIRQDLAAYMKRKQLDRYSPDPVAAMRDRFISALTEFELAQNPEPNLNVGRYEMPHAQLLMAWDLISQPYYKSAYHRGLTESAVKDDARHLGHTITLHANESKLLSAMAEAVGIPNPFGRMPQEKREPK